MYSGTPAVRTNPVLVVPPTNLKAGAGHTGHHESHTGHTVGHMSHHDDCCNPLASGTRRMLALAALAFAAISWIVFSCGAAKSYELLPSGVPRDNVASFSIFLFCMQALILLGSAFAFITGRSRALAGLMSCFLILVISWLAVEADKVLKLVRGEHPTHEHGQRVNVWFAGLVMLALANIALLVIFQLRHLHPDALTGGKASKTESSTSHTKDHTAPAVGGIVVNEV